MGFITTPRPPFLGRCRQTSRSLSAPYLKEDDFLLTSPNAYNTLSLGTTQLYNAHVVYNHKRHGRFTLGGRTFEFRRKPRFPRKLTEEFLLVELLNNLPALAEDTEALRARAHAKAKELDAGKLRLAARAYGKVATRKFFDQALADAAIRAEVLQTRYGD